MSGHNSLRIVRIVLRIALIVIVLETNRTYCSSLISIYRLGIEWKSNQKRITKTNKKQKMQ